MQLITCTEQEHASEILAILNEAIENSTALYDYKPRPASSMQAWFRLKAEHSWPVIGLTSDEGQLLGFATYGSFRSWPAYKYSVEHSIYIHHAHRGQGLGTILLEHLIELAQAREVHTLIGGIDADNRGSIALHRKLGFEHAGTIRQAGYKFGRWLDLAFYQRVLSSPAHPVEG